QKLRTELQAGDNSNGGRIVARQFDKHDPILRGALHPCADGGDDRARSPSPVIAHAERSEGAICAVAWLRSAVVVEAHARSQQALDDPTSPPDYEQLARALMSQCDSWLRGSLMAAMP